MCAHSLLPDWSSSDEASVRCQFLLRVCVWLLFVCVSPFVSACLLFVSVELLRLANQLAVILAGRPDAVSLDNVSDVWYTRVRACVCARVSKA